MCTNSKKCSNSEKLGAKRKSSKSFIDGFIDYIPQGAFALAGAGTSLVVDGVVETFLPNVPNNAVRAGKGLLGAGIAVMSKSKNWKAYGGGMLVEAGSSVVRSLADTISNLVTGAGSGRSTSNNSLVFDLTGNSALNAGSAASRQTVATNVRRSSDPVL